MPPSRSQSSRTPQKRVSTNGLARHIEQLGRAPEMPCSNCHQHNRSCIVDRKKSLSCSECICRKVACDVTIDPDARRESMDVSRRLEEEEEKLMREIAVLQSRLIRTREQKRHSLRRQKEYFDRGMADLAEEMGDSDPLVSEEPATFEPGVALPEVGFDEWAQEQGLDLPEILSPGVAGVGQESVGESSRSHPSG
ncbi:hypothetical protein B0H65DRAFT_436905 [Neurospora tetraspora]|uniref:Zn(2)-C6 fungal-type domain-containing protein n=1 Tax=Neurospora tetraspora TaxID=94610 RepID=A0AAE0J1J3_9PEZI|nr:hypothetical protein B0H65DRAFT_436905 [Neurospora tetraspora]